MLKFKNQVKIIVTLKNRVNLQVCCIYCLLNFLLIRHKASTCLPDFKQIYNLQAQCQLYHLFGMYRIYLCEYLPQRSSLFSHSYCQFCKWKLNIFFFFPNSQTYFDSLKQPPRLPREDLSKPVSQPEIIQLGEQQQQQQQKDVAIILKVVLNYLIWRLA